ncbi:MAG: hypothetical protein RIF39_06365 [Cyclobacteriaceae bacterium]
MKKGIYTSRLLPIQALTSWKAVLEYLSHPNFTKSHNIEVQIIRENETWKIQSNSSTTAKSKPKALTTQCRGVGLFDLNW